MVINARCIGCGSGSRSSCIDTASDFSQLASSFDNYSGPFHHNFASNNSCGLKPCEEMSAGLSEVFTCCHCVESVISKV